MGILEIQRIDGQAKQAVHPSSLRVLIAREANRRLLEPSHPDNRGRT